MKWSQEPKVASLLRELPDSSALELSLYVDEGVIPSTHSFVYAVLANDLYQAGKRADYLNAELLPTYAELLDTMPKSCWGTTSKFLYWQGLVEAAEL